MERETREERERERERDIYIYVIYIYIDRYTWTHMWVQRGRKQQQDRVNTARKLALLWQLTLVTLSILDYVLDC